MKIAFLGDIALVGKYDILKSGEEAVFDRLQEMKAVLEDYDYVIANLESPLTDITVTHEHKSMPLKSAPANVRILEFLGINAVSLANNHVYDYGNKGITDCLRVLESHNIKCFGLGNDALDISIAGEKISLQGFCCFTANGWHYDSYSKDGQLHTLTTNQVKAFIEEAHKKNYYPIIIPHWGDENTHYPKSEHVLFAKTFLNDSICSFVGHHPHVPQGIIYDHNGLCAFSLGNFIFDDCYSEKNGMRVIQTDANKHGYILGMEIKNNQLTSNTIIPYYDSQSRITIDPAGIKSIENYSKTIEALFGKNEYEKLRIDEQQKAREKRLGRRDFRWVKNHLNYSSVMTVIQRKINEKLFVEVVDSIAKKLTDKTLTNKVLYVGNFGMPKTNAPGKRVYANSLLFTKCGYDVLMIGTDVATRGRFEKVTEKISYTSFPNYGKGTGKKYFEWLKRQMEKTGTKPALICRYGSPGLATFDKYLCSYCRRENIPIVVDVVDWLSVDSGNLLFKAIKGTDTFLEKSIYNKKGNGLIAISSYLYNYYGKSYHNKIIVPPLVDRYSSHENSNVVPQIVYAGNPFRKGEQVKDVHAIKDRLDLAITTFISLEKKKVGFDFHVVGMDRDEYLLAFPGQKEVLSKTKHIHFHGHQPMEKAQEIIGTMDFSILLREKTRGTMAGFPTKVVESMSLGVPVITTDTSDLTKYIQTGVNGYIVDISNQAKFEEQLTEILTSFQEVIQGMKQQIVTDQDFIIKKYEDQFVAFIQSVMQ